MEEEGAGEGVLNILIGGNPSESSELFRHLGRELGGMGGTGYSGMGLGGLGGFISEFGRIIC